jgi:presenilin-like A22 family membrane protease
MKVGIYAGIWYLIFVSFGAIWFIFLFVNFIGVFAVQQLFLRKYSFKKLVPILITFLSFFILWPFSFLIVGNNAIASIIMSFVYLPVTFLISVLIMRNPTKNRINTLAYMFSILLPLIIGTLFLPEYALILLAIFAVYDFIAVFWTKHMGYMAQKLIAMSVPEAFLIGDFDQIKERVKNINSQSADNADVANRPLIFGVGDAVLPGIVISSFALGGMHYLALAAVVGGIIGVIMNLGVLRIKRHILPALPLIFVFMVIAIEIAKVI